MLERAGVGGEGGGAEEGVECAPARGGGLETVMTKLE